MTVVESLSTIRDLPVPDELIKQVDLAYVCFLGSSRSEMILNMASAAPPLNPVFHAWTDAVVGNVTKRFNIVCVTYHVTMIRWHTAIGLQNCLVVRLRIHLRNNQGMLKEKKNRIRTVVQDTAPTGRGFFSGICHHISHSSDKFSLWIICIDFPKKLLFGCRFQIFVLFEQAGDMTMKLALYVPIVVSGLYQS